MESITLYRILHDGHSFFSSGLLPCIVLPSKVFNSFIYSRTASIGLKICDFQLPNFAPTRNYVRIWSNKGTHQQVEDGLLYLFETPCKFSIFSIYSMLYFFIVFGQAAFCTSWASYPQCGQWKWICIMKGLGNETYKWKTFLVRIAVYQTLTARRYEVRNYHITNDVTCMHRSPLFWVENTVI